MNADDKYNFKFCIIGQETIRQKLMTIRFLRLSQQPTLAIDSFNAEKKGIIETAKFAIVFRPEKKNDPIKEVGALIDNGWPEFRILVEGDDFPMCGIPSDNIA